MLPARRGTRPMIDFIVVVLPAPFAAEQGDDLAVAHLEIHAVQHVAFAIPGVQAGDL